MSEPLHIALIYETNTPFNRAVLSGVGHYIRQNKPEWRLDLIRDVQKPAADISGFICESGVSEERQQIFDGRPVLYIASAVPAEVRNTLPIVCPDNHMAVACAIDHLKSQGRTHLACYTRRKYLKHEWAQERMEAFRLLSPLHSPLWDGSANIRGESEAQHRELQWLSQLPPQTGVLAINDACALELLTLCERAGRSVPQDISIIGIDNDPLVAALSHLPITSVRQGLEKIGLVAAELLFRMIEEGEPRIPPQTLVEPEGLFLAGTSGPTDSTFRNALDFIQENIEKSIKTEQIASACKISRAALERLFLHQTGNSVHRELLRRRLDLAKTLLTSSGLTAAEIALQTGFRTQQYLNFVFKRELGVSPSEFAGEKRKTTRKV